MPNRPVAFTVNFEFKRLTDAVFVSFTLSKSLDNSQVECLSSKYIVFKGLPRIFLITKAKVLANIFAFKTYLLNGIQDLEF